MVVLSVICALGLALGKIKVLGISLGVTFVFFVGILAGHLGFSIDPQMLSYAENFGLVLFVYALGLQVGPGFFSAFRKDGLTLNALAMGVVIVALSSFVIHFSLDGQFDPLDVVFEEASAFGTVGLSVGISAAASVGSKLILILNMFLGRVGLLSFALAMVMRRGSKKEVLPTARIIIG